MRWSITVLIVLCTGLFILACTPDPARVQYPYIELFEMTETNAADQSIMLRWMVNSADSIWIEGLGGPLLPGGTIRVDRRLASEYTLVAANGALRTTRTLVIPAAKTPRDWSGTLTGLQSSNLPNRYLKGVTSIAAVHAAGDTLEYEIVAIDQSQYPDSIQLHVIVKDANGNFVSGLAEPYSSHPQEYKKYFTHLQDSVEGGFKHEVVDFTVREFHRTESSPVSAVLVLDRSGSMAGSLSYLIAAADEFASNKKPQDEIGAITFHSVSELYADLTTNVPDFNSIGPGAATALYQGIYDGLSMLDSAEHMPVCVVFTDGYDNHSYMTRQVVVQEARKRGVPVYTVGFGGADMRELRSIASLTGGKAYDAVQHQDLKDIFEELWRLRETYYIVTYKPEDYSGQHIVELEGNSLVGKDSAQAHYYIGSNYVVQGDARNFLAQFDFDKDYVQDVYRKRVTEFVKWLPSNGEYHIQLHGHTDLSGSRDYNLDLSTRRVVNVKDEFLINGLRPHQITTEAHSKDRPLHSPDDSPWQSFDNRRVECEVFYTSANDRACAYSILIYSSADDTRARELQAHLLRENLLEDVYIEVLQRRDGADRYEVRVGCFGSKEEAEKEVHQIIARSETMIDKLYGVKVNPFVNEY